MTTATETQVPDLVAELGLLDRVDYEDAYTVSTGASRTPEQWLRAFLEGAPRWFQLPWAGLGKALLGAKFGPVTPTPGYVLGWKILHQGNDSFAVGLDSSAGLRARLIAVTAPGRVVVATLIALDTPYARNAWPVIRRGHRFFAPYLLRRAASR
ncbi:hypothetical protein [Mycobacterium sp. 1423905.2]|uniref:hypothetical protein n=1 Tax=Mycobacterium sp. 1423905.2 TaxID=1856859 RepID=UPI000800D2DE|nr:hypothetical protein [Mycobacterium sp. 1423905.2]OBJ49828.1 hypothetical protein A9W95_25055 [Mycobacterium sp. 1423905.2]